MNDVPPTGAPSWGTDRELDVGLACAALGEAFPELDTAALQPLGSGWDFDTFGIGLRWVARFPRRAEVAERIDTEVEVLPHVGTALKPLGIEVPELHAVGHAPGTFPYPFLVQRRIWGIPLESVGPSRFAIRLAAHLGEALAAVHALRPASELEQAQGDEAEWLAHASEALSAISAEVKDRIPKAIDWIESGAEIPPPYTGPARLLHNDLSPNHIRVARTGLGLLGLLDWSDVAVGDPARDFALLYSWGGPAVLEDMMRAYALELDEGFRERVRFMARVGSIATIRDMETTGGDVERHIEHTRKLFAGHQK